MDMQANRRAGEVSLGDATCDEVVAGDRAGLAHGIKVVVGDQINISRRPVRDGQPARHREAANDRDRYASVGHDESGC